VSAPAPSDLLLLWVREHAARIRADEKRARDASSRHTKETAYSRAIAKLAETHAAAAKVYEAAVEEEEQRLGLRLRCTCSVEQRAHVPYVRPAETCWPHGTTAIKFAEERAARMVLEARRARGFVLRRDDEALAAQQRGDTAFPWWVVPGNDKGYAALAVLIDGGERRNG
jgi:hypothetical protein